MVAVNIMSVMPQTFTRELNPILAQDTLLYIIGSIHFNSLGSPAKSKRSAMSSTFDCATKRLLRSFISNSFYVVELILAQGVGFEPTSQMLTAFCTTSCATLEFI